MAETPPVFIENDSSKILQEIIADYESRTGKVLQPAQAERLLIQSVAYRETLLRGQIQNASQLNLVEFSTAPILDYLGDLVGVTRLASTPATITLQFNLVSGHTGVTIPKGTRVASVDGKAIFELEEDLNANAGTLVVSGSAFCQTAGTVGNGYAIGDIKVILDPQAFIVSASNTDATSGGSDQETDEELRERIKLAPQSFSSAGPTGAYVFYAKSAHPSIVDVFIDSNQPGDVDVYPLTDTGEATTQNILDLVEAALNDEKVRPLTDSVNVISPTKVTGSVTVELTVYEQAVNQDVLDLANAALTAFFDSRKKSLGLDITSSQVIDAAMVEDVYSVSLPSFSDIVIQSNEFASVTYTLSITGTNVG